MNAINVNVLVLNLDDPECVADWNRRATPQPSPQRDEKSTAQEAAAVNREAAFGFGRIVVDTGKFNDRPAVFLSSASSPGEVGASAAREVRQKNRLEPGEDVLTFPTMEQARRVADALVNASPPAAPVADGTDWREVANSLNAALLSNDASHAEQARRIYVRALIAATDTPASAVAEPVALPMEIAPRDGTMIRLLIAPGSFGPLEDSEGPTWTIGANSFDHTEEDRWQFAGWDWQQDCFIEDQGTPIGWLPFHAAPPPIARSDADEPESYERRAARIGCRCTRPDARCCASDRGEFGGATCMCACHDEPRSDAAPVAREVSDDEWFEYLCRDAERWIAGVATDGSLCGAASQAMRSILRVAIATKLAHTASAVTEPDDRNQLELPACPKCGCVAVRAESPDWTDYGVSACLSCDCCDHQWEQTFDVGVTKLWCMHILGPDDVLPAPSKAHAERAVEIFNLRFGPISKETEVMCEAIVARWPHSPESHAAGVGAFCAEWLCSPPPIARSDAAPVSPDVSEAMVRHMVNRFLGWRLPKTFSPDNGISYARPNYAHPPADHDWPVGTHLFNAAEAEAMVRYMTMELHARQKALDD